MEPGDIVHMTQNEHKQKKEHNLDIWAPRTHTIMLTIQTISDEIRTPKSKDMQCKYWKKRDNRMIYKTLHRKLKIVQFEPHNE
jgi:hypothetical protein